MAGCDYPAIGIENDNMPMLLPTAAIAWLVTEK